MPPDRPAPDAIPLDELGREWARQLDEIGQVGLSRSRWHGASAVMFGLIMAGAAVVWVGQPLVSGWSSSGALTFLLGLVLVPAAVGVTGGGLLSLVRRGPQLRVDYDGLTFGVARKSFLPWSGIQDFSLVPAGHRVLVPTVHASTEAVRRMLARRSLWARVLWRRFLRRGNVTIPYCRQSEAAELVAWLDWELPRRAPLPQHLVMSPEKPAVNIYCYETVVHAGRVPMRESTRAALRDWNRRAAARFSMVTFTLPPELAAEARELAAQIQADLPAGSTMSYYEDEPPPEPA